MSERTMLSLDAIEDLSRRVLVASGTTAANAAPVGLSIRRAEADGVHSHGLFRLPTYAEHVRVGKVDGKAMPRLETVGPAGTRADAATGFAHPAITLGLGALVPQARVQGIAALAVINSYNCGASAITSRTSRSPVWSVSPSSTRRSRWRRGAARCRCSARIRWPSPFRARPACRW